MSRITFITPTRKRDPRIVERCLLSVAEQTFADWEQIVCSDGGREPVIEGLVARMGDPRRRYSYVSSCLGHYGAGVRDAMIEHARGDYLASLDDDNIVFPKFAETMVAAMDRNPAAGMAICEIVETRPLPGKPDFAPFIITGLPPVPCKIDALQVVMRKDAIRKTRWCMKGYYSDGHTYETLARQYSWIRVDDVLGMHL